MFKPESVMIETSEEIVNNDSNDEESDDDTLYYDDLFTDFVPLPDKCEHKSQDSNSSLRCCEHCLDGHLMFFMGSLREACQAAFSATLIQERRPILVYIHNAGNLFKKYFCETMFNSLAIVSYLNMNYVVWTWEVTSDSDIHTLATIWEDVFSTQFIDKFSIEKCPLFIGIMRQFEYERDEVTASEYQFETFVEGNTLRRTPMTVDEDNLFDAFSMFKGKCDQHEQNLSFDFVKKTGLCWDVILEIAQYLSINDAISTFSIRVLFRLQQIQSKFQLSNPFDPFIKIILPKINKEEITSVHLNRSTFYASFNEEFLSKFRKVVSVSLYDLSYAYEVYRYMRMYPNLTRLSLSYDNEVDYELLNRILCKLYQNIKRFEIHCPGILVKQCDKDSLKQTSRLQTIIEYFLLDIGHYCRTSTHQHFQYREPFSFITKAGFISTMPKIRCIHLIIKNCDIEHILEDDQWETPIKLCSSLKKIILQVLGNTSERILWMNKVLEIQTQLRLIRPTIKFQINFA